MKVFFITGTDTDCGKTTATLLLLNAAKQRGLKTVALKPIACGAEKTEQGLRNRDALLLQAACTESLYYEEVNPIVLAEATSPHIAAQRANRRLNIRQIAGFCRGTLMRKADLGLIEGAGGWRVPISERELLSELPKELKVPVILVVGMKLGCLNHAILTVESILRDGIRLAGWIPNQLEADMPFYEEYKNTLMQLIPAPCITEIFYQQNINLITPSYTPTGKNTTEGTDLNLSPNVLISHSRDKNADLNPSPVNWEALGIPALT